ncbi:homoserine kinase [Virgibacillus halodenitrificans]|uniref:homoserine kinase n=1 Tax=Virgibacillus halodenitrificans TaxID=1482 RepID=UPI00045D25EC|nr:homoserine kinase [Virgibacillus halodenitrificans]CDQ37138.1 Homoserine kinase [Virgibacillus halodenitrificans]
MMNFKLSVPASTANLGPAFDSAGLAVQLYLHLNVEQSDRWEFVHTTKLLPDCLTYEEHFIYQIAQRTAELYQQNLPPAKVTISSDIPLARGLGSSASAVVAGIELANQLCKLSLSQKDKLQIGTEIEGHPDNIAAALLGGLVITAKLTEDDLEYVHLSDIDLDTVVYIPHVELKTEAARKVIPDHFSKNQATTASSISNVMVAALINGDYEQAGKLMERDGFHEPFRAELIPNYQQIKLLAKEHGAFGTVISGAGPTMISFASKERGDQLAKKMGPLLPEHQVRMVEIDRVGLQVY